MYVGELEDDATLTASDDERADSADLIPHGRCYQPSVDLTRFPKTHPESKREQVQLQEKKLTTTRCHTSHTSQAASKLLKCSVQNKKRRETHKPEKHGRRHIHSSMPLQSSMDGQDCLKSLGEHSPNKQAIFC